MNKASTYTSIHNIKKAQSRLARLRASDVSWIGYFGIMTVSKVITRAAESESRTELESVVVDRFV